MNVPIGETTQKILKKRGDAIGVSQQTIILIHLYYMANKPITITKQSASAFKTKKEKVIIHLSESLWETYVSQVRYELSLPFFLGYVLQESLSEMDKLWKEFEGIEREDVKLSNFFMARATKQQLKNAFFETNINITGLVNVALLLEKYRNDRALIQKDPLKEEGMQLGVRISPPLKSYLKRQAKVNHISMAMYLENTLNHFFEILDINSNSW